MIYFLLSVSSKLTFFTQENVATRNHIAINIKLQMSPYIVLHIIELVANAIFINLLYYSGNLQCSALCKLLLVVR